MLGESVPHLTVTPAAEVRPADDRPERLRRFAAHHEAFVRRDRDRLQDAIRMGEILTQEREECIVQRRPWLKTLKEDYGVSQQAASNWMFVYQHRGELPPDGNFGYTEALKCLKDKHKAGDEEDATAAPTQPADATTAEQKVHDALTALRQVLEAPGVTIETALEVRRLAMLAGKIAAENRARLEREALESLLAMEREGTLKKFMKAQPAAERRLLRDLPEGKETGGAGRPQSAPTRRAAEGESPAPVTVEHVRGDDGSIRYEIRIPGFRLLPTGMLPVGKPTFDQWRDAGRFIRRVEKDGLLAALWELTALLEQREKEGPPPGQAEGE